MTTKKGLKKLEVCLKKVRKSRRQERLSYTRTGGDSTTGDVLSQRIADYSQKEAAILNLIAGVHELRSERAQVKAGKRDLTMDAAVVSFLHAANALVEARKDAISELIRWQDAESPSERRASQADYALARAQAQWHKMMSEHAVKASYCVSTSPEGDESDV